MEKIFSRMDEIHARLMSAVEPIDVETFSRRPSENVWSLAEILHHLSMVEQSVLKALQKEIEAPPQRVGLRGRLMPLRLLVGTRLVRIKAPKFVEPTDAPQKAEAMANFNRVREELKDFAQKHGRERLLNLVFKHRVLGPISGVGALSFVSNHERRHFKQVREIIEKLK